MKFDKQKLLEAVNSVAAELEPFNDQSTEKWADRANIPKRDLSKDIGLSLAERMVRHLHEELPLDGVSYHVVETEFAGETAMADFSDLAPIYLLVRCVDEDRFDMEVVNDNDEMLMSFDDGQSLRQLEAMIKEMHEAALMVSQKAQSDEERTVEENFFKTKWTALRRVLN